MSKTITIDEDKFIDILGSTSAKFCKTELDILKFAIFCGEVHTALFGGDEDTEAPFKVGDKVFVIDNEGDYNNLVNRVVTVVKVMIATGVRSRTENASRRFTSKTLGRW